MKIWKYCKIPLIRSECIYGQRTNLMGLFSGVLIFRRKNNSICNLLNLLFFFFHYKTRILAFFTSCKMWNMFKVNNKGTRIRKVNDKVKNKDTIEVVLASLLLTLNPFNFLLQCFYCWFWSRQNTLEHLRRSDIFSELSSLRNIFRCFADLTNLMSLHLGPHMRGREGGGGGLVYIQRETYIPGVN